MLDAMTIAERLGRIDGQMEGVGQRITSLEKKVCNGDGSVLSELKDIRREFKDFSRMLGKLATAQEGLKVKVAVIAAGCALGVSTLITVLVKVLF